MVQDEGETTVHYIWMLNGESRTRCFAYGNLESTVAVIADRLASREPLEILADWWPIEMCPVEPLDCLDARLSQFSSQKHDAFKTVHQMGRLVALLLRVIDK